MPVTMISYGYLSREDLTPVRTVRLCFIASRSFQYCEHATVQHSRPSIDVAARADLQLMPHHLNISRNVNIYCSARTRNVCTLQTKD